MSVDARRLLDTVRVMDVARRQGFGAVYLKNYALARAIAARIIAA